MKQVELAYLPIVYSETEACITLKVRIDALRAWLRRDELRAVAQDAYGRPLFSLSDLKDMGARLAAQEKVRVLQPRRPYRPDRPPPKLAS